MKKWYRFKSASTSANMYQYRIKMRLVPTYRSALTRMKTKIKVVPNISHCCSCRCSTVAANPTRQTRGIAALLLHKQVVVVLVIMMPSSCCHHHVIMMLLLRSIYKVDLTLNQKPSINIIVMMIESALYRFEVEFLSSTNVFSSDPVVYCYSHSQTVSVNKM